MNTTSIVALFVYFIYVVFLSTLEDNNIWLSTKIAFCLCGLFTLIQPIKHFTGNNDTSENNTSENNTT